MSDFSVRAILSAQDRGFSSTLKNAIGQTESLGQKIKSGFAFGMLTGAGQQAFSMLTNGARNLVSEIDASNAAWKTFEGNMKMTGKTSKEINKTKKELQAFAESSVYSSSDMAQTYAQLEAVGVKGTTKLVKGFGGLASAAENPQQAMKTLSQQATQMAAKPQVAWADFKLMLEQTPAGIAAIAKDMGMSTAEMVTAVQDGKIATDDFFESIARVGTNDAFSKMATEYKTVGQAADGLQETIGNKLSPAFELLTEKGISAIEGISEKVGKLDGDAIEDKLTKGMKAAEPYWNMFKDTCVEVWGVLKKFGSFLNENRDTIAKYAPTVLKLVVAFKAFSILKSIVPGMSLFTQSITALAGKGISAIAGKLFGVAAAETAAGSAGATSATQVMAAAKSFMMMGVAVLMVSVGFGILAQSAIALASAGGGAVAVMAGLVLAMAGLGAGMAFILKTLAPMGAQMIPVATAMLAMGAAVVLVAAGFALMAYASIQLANAGGGAIAVMAGMVATLALLAVGAAALGTALTAGAIGFIAFGAAILLVGAGTLLAAAGMALLAAQLPIISTYGTQSAVAITQLGAAMVAFAAGAVTAGAGLVALGVGFGGAAVGVIAFGAGLVVAAAGAVALDVALKLVKSSMKNIEKSASKTEKSLISMTSSVSVVESGLGALEGKAKSVMKSLTSVFDNTAKDAKSAGEKTGKGFASGMQGGLKNSVNNAKDATNSVTNSLRGGYDGAYKAGAYISHGFANGMTSQLYVIQTAAELMAAAAEKAIRAKAQIHSPSRVSEKLGQYYGEGYVGGMLGMVKDAWKAAKELVSVPTVATPQFAGAFGGEMSADYDYYRNSEYTIEVPVVIEGRRVAKATATYMQDELDRKQARENRKHGKL